MLAGAPGSCTPRKSPQGHLSDGALCGVLMSGWIAESVGCAIAGNPPWRRPIRSPPQRDARTKFLHSPLSDRPGQSWVSQMVSLFCPRWFHNPPFRSAGTVMGVPGVFTPPFRSAGTTGIFPNSRGHQNLGQRTLAVWETPALRRWHTLKLRSK